MKLTGFKPMNANTPTSPSGLVEGRAGCVDRHSAAVKHSNDKTHLSFKQSLKKQLEPITRPLVKNLNPLHGRCYPPSSCQRPTHTQRTRMCPLCERPRQSSD
ncbi:hypothetical protein CPB85DRAFT_1251284 [Mucidula mucida]|nr:hypothetical protein CPB85DRAFT_1251284 [Mucidula mucida]